MNLYSLISNLYSQYVNFTYFFCLQLFIFCHFVPANLKCAWEPSYLLPWILQPCFKRVNILFSSQKLPHYTLQVENVPTPSIVNTPGVYIIPKILFYSYP